MDSYNQEKIIKGIANHRRIEVLYLLAGSPSMSVEEIAEACRIDYKTVASHLKRMTLSGLITKTNYGRRVEHKITKLGSDSVKFLRTLS